MSVITMPQNVTEITTDIVNRVSVHTGTYEYAFIIRDNTFEAISEGDELSATIEIIDGYIVVEISVYDVLHGSVNYSPERFTMIEDAAQYISDNLYWDC